MNLVAFVGKINELPVLRESANGNKYAIMPIRVQRSFMNSEGIYEEDDIAVTLWRGIAQQTVDIAKCGDSIAVKGRVQSHMYEGSDGQLHRSYDIIAEQVSFLMR